MQYPLLTERLSISPLNIDDLDAFVSYRQDLEIARFQSWDVDFSRNQAIDLIQSQAELVFPPIGQWLQLGIRDRSTGYLLGDLALHNLEQENHYEIGFTVAKENQGKGIGKEALAKLLEVLFTENGGQIVEASTDRRNVASIRLLQSLGFTQEPNRSWVELFKGEIVTVDVFELRKSSSIK